MSKERIRRISLLFTEGEYEAVKSLSGAMPLTRFFKALVVESVQRAHVEAIRAAGVKETTGVGEFDYQLNPKFVENENRTDENRGEPKPAGRGVSSGRGSRKVAKAAKRSPVAVADRLPDVHAGEVVKLTPVTDYSDEDIRRVVEGRVGHLWNNCFACQRAYTFEFNRRQK
jgi:hypothetical protein